MKIESQAFGEWPAKKKLCFSAAGKLELVYVIQGELLYKSSSEQFRVLPDMVLLVTAPPKKFLSTGKEGCSYFYVKTKRDDSFPAKQCRIFSSTLKLTPIVNNIRREVSNTPWEPWKSKEMHAIEVQRFVIQCMREFYKLTASTKAPGEDELIQEIQARIKSSIYQNPNVTQLLNGMPLSHRQLSRIFLKQTGTSIKHAQLIQKLEEAKRLIENSNSGMTEIAYKLNFSSSQHFSQCYKKWMGVSPKAHQMSLVKDP